MADSRKFRLPDFIIAGAPRAATTWLYVLADRHPDIAMAKPMRPEPKFFLVDALYQKGLAYYADHWFAELPAGLLLGEKSTNYLEGRAVAERLHLHLPDIRLIFMLRNPIDRAYSNYLWSRQNGLETESFERALALEGDRERSLAHELRYARPFAYFSRGLYVDDLTRFFRLFPRQRILVLRTEDVAEQPREVAEKFHRFLGVAPMPELAADLGVVNAAVKEDTKSMPAQLRTMLARRYEEPNRRLSQLLGPDFELWPQA